MATPAPKPPGAPTTTPVKKMAIPPKPGAKNTAPKSKAPSKKFSISDWDGGNDGERILIHAESGMGKTTCASMAPSPVWIGLDDGGRKISNPITGENLRHIPGVETFDDVRAALQQVELFDDCETVVIDTVTLLEELAVPYVLENIPNEKGAKMPNITKYGYGKGYRHLYDTMKLILADCDVLVRRGKNIIMIAQSVPNRVANSAGEDYLRDGPRLCAQNNANVEALYCEWSDHVFRIGYRQVSVEDRKAESDQQRAIFVHGAAHFRAKSRTISTEYPVVSFESPADDSIWKFLFPGEADE